jgi:hypothetical protein
MAMHLTVARVAVSAFVVLLIAVSQAQVTEPSSEVRGIVFDESGAVIPGCEVMFRSDLNTIVSHTGTEGTVTARLQPGTYSVTTLKAGFVTSKMLNFQIGTQTPDTFQVVLKVDSTPTDGGDFDGVPTAASELPNLIRSEASHAPSAQLGSRKRRSFRCLYLWKCSSS